MKIHYFKINLKIANISKIIKESILLLLILALVWQCFPRATSLAALDTELLTTPSQEVIIEVKSAIELLGEPIRVITVPVTAYNSLPGQTDATPCTTANGFDLCKNDVQNVIAANFLKFGTKVRFPDFDPDTIYTVQDRMNARYTYRADIWMKEYSDARKFGIKRLRMEIYE
jgi:3D (Asp-Asp-Asp) domain-containing protein